jgi:hypothetical protein
MKISEYVEISRSKYLFPLVPGKEERKKGRMERSGHEW